jgi:glucose/arabinose dehydrogenase
MKICRRSVLLSALAFFLLLGCGSGQTASAQPTATAQKPAATAQSPTAAPAAKASPAAAASPTVARVASPAASPAAAPRVAAGPRAQLGSGSPAVRLEPVVRGLEQPTVVTHAGDGSGRLFVVEKRGRIRIVRNGVLEPTPFLDIAAAVKSSGSEQGLLGLAFHPRFVENGVFFVNYTDTVAVGNTVVQRFQVGSGTPDRADPNSGQQLLYVEQPAANHNGGHLAFGPDGYLYIGLGDGGRAGDPWGNAQNRGVLLGKMLRIDVDGGPPYGIPADNPFVNDPSARPEIWAYGLRNPWRYTFDRATGDLYIGDVGQNAWEWVHLQRAGSPGGQNYGWNRIEGSHCYPAGSACDPSQFVLPILEYDHAQGCSLTGGHVYRGPSFPQLAGLYFYADYCSGRLWAAQESAPGQWQSQELLQAPRGISSFGEDEAGDVYLVILNDGGLYRLAAS